MTDNLYNEKDKEKATETDNYSHQKFPRLISGLRERCLVRLINPEDFLKLRIVPVQRE